MGSKDFQGKLGLSIINDEDERNVEILGKGGS